MASTRAAVAAAAHLRRRPPSARGLVSDASGAPGPSSAGTLVSLPAGRVAWASSGGQQQGVAKGGPAASTAAAPSPPLSSPSPTAGLFGGGSSPSAAASLLLPHLPPCPATNPFSCAWRGAAGPWAALGGRAFLASPAMPPPPVPLPRPGFGRLVPHPHEDAARPVVCVVGVGGAAPGAVLPARPPPSLRLPAPLLPPLLGMMRLGGGASSSAALLSHYRGLATSALVAAPPPPPAASPTPHAPPPPPPPPPTTPNVSGPTADLCDFAISELDDTKSRVESAKAQAAADADAVTARVVYAPPSLASRAAGAVKAAGAGLATAAAFTVSAPGAVYGFFAKTTKAERRATYGRWWATAKAEARHYWAGLKLLGADVRIAGRLVGAAASGRALTRRERRQLTRTVADVFRLVPVAVFLVVPFMEFLLPVALKVGLWGGKKNRGGRGGGAF